MGKLANRCTDVSYRVAQKERNTYDQLFQENEGQYKQVACIIAYKKIQQDDTKIINFDEGFLILWPFFWGNVIFTSVLKVAIDVPKILFYCWLPRAKCLLLLWKMKAAWIKRSIHYVTLQRDNPGKALKEIHPYLNRDFWNKRSKFWKWHCFRRMALKSKRLHQKHWSWCHFTGKRIFYAFMHSLIWFSPWFLCN